VLLRQNNGNSDKWREKKLPKDVFKIPLSSMKRLFPLVVVFGFTADLLVSTSLAAEPLAKAAAAEEINKICPISGKPADPNITVVYEDRTYAFANEESRTKWNEARKSSLYHKLGGKAAIDAAVEAFYVKVLADKRINEFFENINMAKQRRKQKEFLSAAFGGPIPWQGKDLRRAHADLELTDVHFNAVAENLQKTLEELKIPKDLIAQVMTIAASTRDDVLHRKPAAK
jgi:hemoglobin